MLQPILLGIARVLLHYKLSADYDWIDGSHSVGYICESSALAFVHLPAWFCPSVSHLAELIHTYGDVNVIQYSHCIACVSHEEPHPSVTKFSANSWASGEFWIRCCRKSRRIEYCECGLSKIKSGPVDFWNTPADNRRPKPRDQWNCSFLGNECKNIFGFVAVRVLSNLDSLTRNNKCTP